MTRTDDDLVRALRAGEPGAFDAIHHRYHPSLLAFARQMLGGRHHDAEEVVQDAFLRALGALSETERDMALRPWLYAITRNRALDELRRPQRTVPFAHEDLGMPLLEGQERDAASVGPAAVPWGGDPHRYHQVRPAGILALRQPDRVGQA